MTAARKLVPIVVAALLSGCLIPQPDTPPIGPFIKPSASEEPVAPSSASPADASPGLAPLAPSPSGDTIGTAERAPVRLTGRVIGARASRITAVPLDPGVAGVLVAPDADGRFELHLPDGRSYRIELVVSGKTIAVTPDLVLNGDRDVTIKVDGEVATVP